jgi:hypothetical protein
MVYMRCILAVAVVTGLEVEFGSELVKVMVGSYRGDKFLELEILDCRGAVENGAIMNREWWGFDDII